MDALQILKVGMAFLSIKQNPKALKEKVKKLGYEQGKISSLMESAIIKDKRETWGGGSLPHIRQMEQHP